MTPSRAFQTSKSWTETGEVEAFEVKREPACGYLLGFNLNVRQKSDQTAKATWLLTLIAHFTENS